MRQTPIRVSWLALWFLLGHITISSGTGRCPGTQIPDATDTQCFDCNSADGGLTCTNCDVECATCTTSTYTCNSCKPNNYYSYWPTYGVYTCFHCDKGTKSLGGIQTSCTPMYVFKGDVGGGTPTSCKLPVGFPTQGADGTLSCTPLPHPTTQTTTTTTCSVIPKFSELSDDKKALILSWKAEDYSLGDEMMPPPPPSPTPRLRLAPPVDSTPTQEIIPAYKFLRERKLPPRFNLSDEISLGPVRDQHPCGTCQSAAIAGAIEGTFKRTLRKPNAPIEVSMAWIASCIIGISCSKELNYTDPRWLFLEYPLGYNMVIERMSKTTYAKRKWNEIPDPKDDAFTVSEACFPYKEYLTARSKTNDDPVETCRAKCVNDNLNYRATVSNFEPLETTGAQKEWIYNYGPVLGSIRVTNEFLIWQTMPAANHQDPDCIFDGPRNSEPASYNHAVLVVGWGITSYGREYWIFRDSRGERFCDNGLCKVAAGSWVIAPKMTGLVLGSRYRNSTGIYEWQRDST